MCVDDNSGNMNVVFLGATKANNSSNTKIHFQHAYTSSNHMTTLSRATGVPDVYRTLHLPLSPLINS